MQLEGACDDVEVQGIPDCLALAEDKEGYLLSTTGVYASVTCVLVMEPQQL